MNVYQVAGILLAINSQKNSIRLENTIIHIFLMEKIK